MKGFDYTGLSILIGAIAGLITVVGGFAMQVLAYIRQGQLLRGQVAQTAAGVERDKKLDTIHDLANGQSELLKQAAFVAGEKAGADAERENPTTKPELQT